MASASTYAFIKNISHRDLKQWLELHEVEAPTTVGGAPTDTQTFVWGKSFAYIDLQYWSIESLGFVIFVPKKFTDGDDWRQWYFLYEGARYFWKQVQVLPEDRLLFVQAQRADAGVLDMLGPDPTNLDIMVELHKVVLSPSSDTPHDVLAKLIAYPNISNWSPGALGFVIETPNDLLTGDWMEWYIVYAGLNYQFYQFWVLPGGEYVFIETRNAIFASPETLPSPTQQYASDADAAAGGVPINGAYWTLPAHDRTGPGTLVRRLE